MPRLLTPFLLCALVALACAGPIAAAEPYEIDAILPLTGQAAFIGKGSAEGLQAAELTVNKAGGIKGRPVKFVVADDQSNPQIDVQLAGALIAKHVPIILGSAVVAGCNAIVPLVKNGPVLYCLSPALHPEPHSYVFSTSIAASDTLMVALRYARLRGWTRIATIMPTDATGQEADKSVDAALALPENKTLTIADREHFNLGDVSVTAQLARIRAANPQFLIAWVSGTATGTVFRGLTESAYDVPVLTSNANATYGQMRQLAGVLPQRLYFAGLPSMMPNDIIDRATKKAVDTYDAALSSIGIVPEVVQSSAWDPALIVVDALRNLGTETSADRLRDYIANLHGWVGTNGPYDFRAFPQRGLGPSAAAVVRWDRTKGSWIAVSKPGGNPLRNAGS